MRTAVLCQVVGVTFVKGYPENLLRLHELIAEHGRDDEGIAAVLIRDPENAHDPNAVQIHVPAIGRIGSVPRTLASKVGPSMDRGERFTAEVTGVRINPEHGERPGVDVVIGPAEEGQP